MSYENAPATLLLATSCACCGRPLVDAASVQAGVGPECRKKHGFFEEVSEEARTAANKLVYEIAVERSKPSPDFKSIAEHAYAVRTLGLTKLADVILRRTINILIESDGNVLSVKTPYSESSVASMRSIPGRRWDAEKKVNTFPVASKRSLFETLCSCFPGALALGPKGPFVLA